MIVCQSDMNSSKVLFTNIPYNSIEVTKKFKCCSNSNLQDQSRLWFSYEKILPILWNEISYF